MRCGGSTAEGLSADATRATPVTVDGGLRRLRVAVLAAASALAIGSTALAATDARASIDRLYDRYRESGFCAICAPERVFDRSTAALISHERGATPPGEVGVLDFDPLCQCQDPGGMRARLVAIRKSGDRADADVALHFSGSGDERRVRLVLVRERRAWRVHDVVGAHGGLRALLLSAR